MSNFKSQIRAYDIIEISKLHTNNIFSKIKKGESQIDFSNQKFIKKRPAIVLKNFNNFFIVLPLTTRSINNNENCKEHLTLRTSFSIEDIKPSYIMYDSILRISKDQVVNNYYSNRKKISLTVSQRSWLKKESKTKILNLLNV